MTRWRGWSLVSFILVLALAATALPDGPARAKQTSKTHWVYSAPLPPGIVSAAHKTPQLPPTQPPAPTSGPMYDAVQKIKAAQNHVPVNAAGTPPRADVAAQNAKLAAARAKGWLVGNGPATGHLKAPRFKVGPDNIGDSKAAPAGAVYGATYAPASGFDVNPRYDTPGEMWVTVSNAGNFTWAANTVSMGYHLYRSDGSIYNFNGLSSAITVDVPAGSSVNVYCSFGYLPAGSFKLVWDLRDDTSSGGPFFSSYGVPAAQAIAFTVPHYPPTGIVGGPADGATVNTTNPQLFMLVNADGTRPNSVEYEICDSPVDTSGSCWNSGWLAVNWSSGSFSSSISWRPPASTLKWNTTYYWHARVQDSSSTTLWSAMSAVIPVVTSPTGAHYATGSGSTDQVGVDLFLGTYTRTEKDFTVQAPGFNLDFTRTYNSANPVQGIFGVGWSSILDMKRTIDPATGIITISYPDGRMVDYGQDPDGSYVPGYGESSEAVVFTPNAVRMGNAEYWFSLSSGQLDHIIPDTYSSNAAGTARNQYIIYFKYDASGRPSTITEGTDFTAKLVYDGNGHLNWIAPSGQRSVYYSFVASSPQLQSVGDRRSDIISVESYGYMSGTTGLLTTITRLDGQNQYIIRYAGDNTVAQVAVPGEDPNASTWQYLRDPPPSGGNPNASLVDAVTDPRGTTTSYEFSYSGSLLARWSGVSLTPSTPARSWLVGPFGQVSSMLDENGNATLWQWASEGWLNGITRYRDGQTSTTTAYIHQTLDANGQILQPGDPRYGEVTQTIDPDGHVVNRTYDANGSLVTQSTAVNKVAGNAATTTYAYTCDNNSVPPTVVNDTVSPASTLQPCNLRASMTDPDGRVTNYAYDRLGRQTRVTTPAGQVTNTFYDTSGNVAKKIVVDGGTSAETDYTYDEDGHLLTQLDPAATNQITGVSHHLLTTDAYDADGDLATSTQSDKTAATAGGDASRQTIYGYDGQGNRTSTATNGVTTSSATYDALGEMVTETDAKGTVFHCEAASCGFEVCGEVPGQLDDPGGGRVSGDAEQVDLAGGVLDDERDVDPGEGDRAVDVEEVGG